jgi:hypothetical protein
VAVGSNFTQIDEQQPTTMNNKKLKRRIRQCEAEIESIRTLPYYTLFNRESERAADLQEAVNKLAVIREKYSVVSRSRQELTQPYHRTSDSRHPTKIFQSLNL